MKIIGCGFQMCGMLLWILLAISAAPPAAATEDKIPTVRIFGHNDDDDDENRGWHPPPMVFFDPWGGPTPDVLNRYDVSQFNSGLSSSCNSKVKREAGPTTNPGTDRPVVIASGEKYLVEPDFESQAIYGMSVIRTYRSVHKAGKAFGSNWLSGIERPQLVFGPGGTYGPTSVTIVDEAGEEYTLNAVPNQTPNVVDYVGPLSIGHLRYFTNQGFTLYKDNKQYQYDNGGLISQVLALNGTVLMKYLYENADKTQVTTIQNSAGRSIIFAWTNGLVTQVIDPNGQVWKYEYNTNHMLSKVTAPVEVGGTAAIREYLYEDPSDSTLLSGVLINGLRYSTYKYDSSKRVLSSMLVGGEEGESFAYGTNYTTVTDARGEVVTYTYATYDNDKKLVSVSRAATSTCAAGTSQIVYQPNGDVNYELDWNNNKTIYVYNDRKGLISATTGAGGASQLTKFNTWYQDRVQSTEFRDVNGSPFRKVDYTYKTDATKLDFGQLDTITTTDLSSSIKPQRKIGYTYTYYPDGVPASLTTTYYLSTGNETEVTNFDAYGNKTSFVNRLGQAVNYNSYDQMGHAGKFVDLNGVSTIFNYYLIGLLKSSITQLSTGNRTISYVYDFDRKVTDIRFPDGSAIRYRYAASERLLKKGDAEGNFASINYDIPSRTTTISSSKYDPIWSGGALTASLNGTFVEKSDVDSLGRLQHKFGNNGQRWDYQYDGNGNVTSIKDAVGNSIVYEYDSLNRKTKETINPEGSVTQYHYNSAGDLDWIKDARNVQTQYAYNGFGEVIGVSSPDVGTRFYGYDSDGRMLYETRNGQTINYQWDGLGRIVSRSSGSATETFVYDQGINGKGHLTSFSNGSGQTSYTYTAAGELNSQTSLISGQTIQVNWSYNSAGQLSSLTYPSGFKINYNYNAAGKLTAITSSLAGTWNTIADSFLYQPVSGLLYGWRFGSNSPQMFTFDSDGLKRKIESPSIQSLQLDYDAANRLVNRANNLDATRTGGFGYDSASRVVSASRSAGGEVFRWDLIGNRTSHVAPNGAFSYQTSPTSNQLTRWASTAGNPERLFYYDDVGNLSTEQYTTGSNVFSIAYNYDAFGRMSSVVKNNSTVGTYTYNALGQRVQKNASGITSRFIYGQNGELLVEAGATPSEYIWLGDTLMGLVRNGQFYASHNDQVDRPEVLTDGAGSVVWKADNIPFDRTILVNSVPLNLGFSGQQYDGETGLWYNVNRYYDATIGRYIQSDPVGLNSNINVYAYASGNPLTRSDPDGLADFASGKPNFIRGVPAGSCTCTSGSYSFAAPAGTDFKDVYQAGVNSGFAGIRDTGFLNFNAGRAAIAQFGKYDFQRNIETNSFIPAYTNAANFGVGVYMRAAGFTKFGTILIGQSYALANSSNAGAAMQAKLWQAGWEAANSGQLDGVCK